MRAKKSYISIKSDPGLKPDPYLRSNYSRFFHKTVNQYMLRAGTYSESGDFISSVSVSVSIF